MVLSLIATAAQAEVGDQPPQPSATLEEIVVTASKRSEKINTVPMSITALTGDTLTSGGITDPAGLAKVVTGFQYAEAMNAHPVYTMRGVGFYTNDVDSGSTVTVYVDQIPFPYISLTQSAQMDLERVEVLKGPQGLLFGENSTGGAINYIAAKPTRDLAAGMDVTINNFGGVQAAGYVSGPLSDTVRARLAVDVSEGGAWQKSLTRPDDRLGAKDKKAARLLLDWDASDRLTFELNLNATVDNSDIQAPQFLDAYPNARSPSIPTTCIPPDLGKCGSPTAIAALPAAPHNNRAADWSPERANRRHMEQYQAALRGQYQISNEISLTSLTSYIRWRDRRDLDGDGTALANFGIKETGAIDSFSQEIHISKDVGELKWIVGGNYEWGRTDQLDIYSFGDRTTLATAAATTSAYNVLWFNPINVGTPYQGNSYTNRAHRSTYAAFANADYNIGPLFTVHAGARYTDMRSRAVGCSLDDPDHQLSNALSYVFGFAPVSGGCIIYNVDPDLTASPPVLPTGFAAAKPRLNENNVSWRVGVDFKPTQKVLIYASISKGYKQGSFPNLDTQLPARTAAATQESILAYEVGFKAGLLRGALQINGGAFYYDYRDKQFRTRFSDPIFGAVETLTNVPKSRVKGAELSIDWAPVRGLRLNVAGTYLDTKIIDSTTPYTLVDTFNIPYASAKGESFPYAPKLQLNGGFDYRWELNGALTAFAGVSGRYQTSSHSAIGQLPIDRKYLGIKSYGTIDMQVGVEGAEGKWRATLFGRNITNTYYWSSATRVTDTIVRYTGAPATYGATVSIKY
jgi:outer membrane receptor protein involved in Fe transport